MWNQYKKRNVKRKRTRVWLKFYFFTYYLFLNLGKYNVGQCFSIGSSTTLSGYLKCIYLIWELVALMIIGVTGRH